MVKYICDKCAEEVMELNRIEETIDAVDALGVTVVQWHKCWRDLCNKCHSRFKRSNLDIAEFMKLPIEDLQIYNSMFEVGDEVITSTGKVGVITDICTCEKCKERGFYEPTVETKKKNWKRQNMVER